MWIAQMLRHESYLFFELLLRGETLEEVAGYLYSVRQTLSRRKEMPAENTQLKQLLKEAGIEDQARVERLTRLVEASRSRSSQRFRYACELANRPPALTWKEFHSIRAKWGSDPRPDTLGGIDRQARGGQGSQRRRLRW